VPPSVAPLGCKELDEVMTGSSVVFCRVAIEQTLGKPSTVGVAEGAPLYWIRQTEVGTTEGTGVAGIVDVY
jgi:hypothetical protein